MSARAGAPAKKTPKGTLIIIGGSEDKAGEMAILSDIARRVGKGKLVLITVASEEPEHVWATYDRVFRALGVKNIEHLGLSRRAEVMADPHLKILKGAKVIFFSGGDQLKLCSELGGTPVSDKIREMYWSGATIAGTSAGATAIGEIMVFGGPPLDGDKFQLAQGLRLLPGTIIDQHFAQRHRLGRLLGAVAQNPAMLGLGIDEDTAIVVKDGCFRVIGTHGVYVIDGRGITSTNVSEVQQNRKPTICLFDARLHILAAGNEFDLKSRRPLALSGTGSESGGSAGTGEGFGRGPMAETGISAEAQKRLAKALPKLARLPSPGRRAKRASRTERVTSH